MRFVIIMLAVTLATSAGCSRPSLTPLEEARENFKNGDWSDVIDQCSAMVALDVDDVDAYMLRGRARIEIDKPQQAVDDFSRVIKLSADDPEGYYFRAIAYKMLGDDGAAYEDDKYAKTIDPDYLMSFPHGTPKGQRDLLVLDSNTLDDESEEDQEELDSGHDAEDNSEEKNGIGSGQNILASAEPPMDETASPAGPGKLWTPGNAVGIADLLRSRFLDDTISSTTSMGRTAVESDSAKSDEGNNTEQTEGDVANNEKKEPKPSDKIKPKRDPRSPAGIAGRLGAYDFHVPFIPQAVRATGINRRMPEQPLSQNSSFSNNATSAFSTARHTSYFGNPDLIGYRPTSSKGLAVTFHQLTPTTGLQSSVGNQRSGGRFANPIVTHTPGSFSGISPKRPLASEYHVLFPQMKRPTGFTPSPVR